MRLLCTLRGRKAEGLPFGSGRFARAVWQVFLLRQCLSGAGGLSIGLPFRSDGVLLSRTFLRDRGCPFDATSKEMNEAPVHSEGKEGRKSE